MTDVPPSPSLSRPPLLSLGHPFLKWFAALAGIVLLGVLFDWLRSLYLAYVPANPWPGASVYPHTRNGLYCVPIMLLERLIWGGGIITWFLLQKKARLPMPDADGSAVPFIIKDYLVLALRLFLLILTAKLIFDVREFLSMRQAGQLDYLRNEIGQIWFMTLIGNLNDIAVIALALPLFFHFTWICFPREKGKITALILPILLTILLQDGSQCLGMLGMILLITRYRFGFHPFGLYDHYLYQQGFVLPLLIAVGWFVIRRARQIQS